MFWVMVLTVFFLINVAVSSFCCDAVDGWVARRFNQGSTTLSCFIKPHFYSVWLVKRSYYWSRL